MTERVDLERLQRRWSTDGGMGNDRSADDYTDAGCRVLAAVLPVVQEALDEKDAAIEKLLARNREWQAVVHKYRIATQVVDDLTAERDTLWTSLDISNAERDAARADLARTESALTAALEAVEKVRALHAPVVSSNLTWCAEDQTTYPCHTVRALPAVDPTDGGEK